MQITTKLRKKSPNRLVAEIPKAAVKNFSPGQEITISVGEHELQDFTLKLIDERDQLKEELKQIHKKIHANEHNQ